MTRRPERARAAVRRIAIVTATTALMFGALVPTVAADGGLEVTTAYPAVAVAPGSKVSFDLKVTSTRETNVGLTLSGVPAGWTATLHGGGFVIDGVAAGPGADGTARLDVSVPADAAASTQTIKVTASGGGNTDVLTISVRVDAKAAGDITVTTTTPVMTGSSNGTFPFALTVHNDTAQDVTVSATASIADHPDWDIKAEIAGSEQTASTVVTAGSTTSVNVTADPPDDAAAGQYVIDVEVTAGDQKIPQQLGVELTGSYSMTLTTPGGLLSAHGGAGSATQQQFILTNTGTATIQGVKVSATPPTGWTVTWDKDTVDVPTDAPVTVTATITPSGEAVAGDYVITFNANSDQADSSAQVRFTVETSPLWAFIGIGIIAVILLGLFYVFRTYGRR